MNILKWSNLFKSGQRLFSCTPPPCTRPMLFENLSSSRTLLRVAGDEVNGFLQGLITNDINHVTVASPNNAMFAMFLNKQGRVLFDAIIYKCTTSDNTFFIECDQRIDEQLKRHLQLFRVRKKISIDTVRDEFNVWAIFQEYSKPEDTKQTSSSKREPFLKSSGLITCSDPRLNLLGTRLIAPSDHVIENFREIIGERECLPSTDAYNYAQHRYACGVSEGVTEIATGKSFPFEANCDFLHGISFHKGCYLGQEFTARTYHTGVIRKRVMPVVLDNLSSAHGEHKFDYDTTIANENDQPIGKLKGIRNRNAIAVLKVDDALKASHLKINDLIATTYRPVWWPQQKKLE